MRSPVQIRPLQGVLLAGAVFSLLLVAQVRSGVFFSGDGGLKFMITAQVARGDLRPSLHLAEPDWVLERGLYPLSPPFAYELGGQHYIQYPVYFSFLTAPLYRAFGTAGLYVIPLLSLWACWLLCAGLGRRLGLSEGDLAIALGILVFASPLTLYGAMYWEHTLGVALGLGGLLCLLSRGRTGLVLLGGALLGLSFVIRSEMICFTFAVLLAAMISRQPRWAWALPSLLVVVSAWVAINLAIYGYPLGAHSLSVVKGLSLASRLQGAAVLFPRLGALLLTVFPVGVVSVLLALLGRRDPRALLMLGVVLAFLFTVPFILPPVALGGVGGKQWGPRFFLAVMPLMALLGAWAWRAAWSSERRALRLGGSAVMIAAIGYAAFVNSFTGPRMLARDYSERVLPALRWVAADASPIVAVSSHFVTMEFSSLMPGKSFVLARGWADLEAIGQEVWKRGGRRFVLVAWPPRSFRTSRALPGALPAVVMTVTPRGQLGDYQVHEVLMESH